MAKKEKVLTAAEAQNLLEEIRKGCAGAVKMESAEDAGMSTIEELEKVIGKVWARTAIVVEEH